jgi:hypothetical protein
MPTTPAAIKKHLGACTSQKNPIRNGEEEGKRAGQDGLGGRLDTCGARMIVKGNLNNSSH